MRPALFVILTVAAAATASAKDASLYPTRDCSKLTAQMDLNQCAQANADAADKVLNAAYQQVMLWLPTQRAKNNLKSSERVWIKKRDAECNDEVGDQADGGSIWPMEMANCQEKQTASRIRVLNKMRQCTAGASVCNPH